MSLKATITAWCQQCQCEHVVASYIGGVIAEWLCPLAPGTACADDNAVCEEVARLRAALEQVRAASEQHLHCGIADPMAFRDDCRRAAGIACAALAAGRDKGG